VFALVCEAIGYGEARRRLGVDSTGFPFDALMAVDLNVDRTMATAGFLRAVRGLALRDRGAGQERGQRA